MKSFISIAIMMSILLQPFSRMLSYFNYSEHQYFISSEEVVKGEGTVFCGSKKAVFQKINQEESKKEEENKKNNLPETSLLSDQFSSISIIRFDKVSELIFPHTQLYQFGHVYNIFHPPTA